MNEAVIVSTARTGVGKAYRGALNNTEGPTMAGHVIAEAVKRARIEPGEVEDVVMGCAMQQGTMVMNVARKGAIRAGLPVTVAGTTIDRQCASGLQAIAVAARSVTLAQDEGPRPVTTAAGLAGIKPVFEGKTISAGNASQLSDGASACVVMSDTVAAQKGIKPLGVFRGFVAAGVEPDEMGVGPVVAITRLLKRHGLKIDDIDLWELNEAYAVQVIYCRDKLGIDPEKLNVNGGSIS